MDQTVKQILSKHPLRVGVVSAILVGGVLGGAVAFADTGSGPAPSTAQSTQPAATPNQGATPNGTAQGRKAARHPRVVGKVVNVSPTGGLSNQGTITVAEPDGHQTTFSLDSATKAWKYQGQGQKPVKESATSIPTNEVIAAGLRTQQGGVSARRILDTGFKAS